MANQFQAFDGISRFETFSGTRWEARGPLLEKMVWAMAIFAPLESPKPAFDVGTMNSKFDDIKPIGQNKGFIVSVLDFEVYKDELYCCGNFFEDRVDQIFFTYTNIAKYDPEIGLWVPLTVQNNPFEFDLNMQGSKMVVFNDLLVISGFFTEAGEINSIDRNLIVTWDGSSYGSIGGLNVDSPLFETIDDIKVFQDDLYACGKFETLDPDTNYFLKKWTGSTWVPASPTEQSLARASAMGVYKGVLYFATTDESEVDGTIRKFSGSGTFETVAIYSGFGGIVINVITEHNGFLYFGGKFQTVDGVDSTNVIKYNGEEFTKAGSGLIGTDVVDLLSNASFLFAAGQFGENGNGDQMIGMAKIEDGGDWEKTWDDEGLNASSTHGRALHLFNGELSL